MHYGLEIKTISRFVLPTSKEGETIDLGRAPVFLEILENVGLINIYHKKIDIGGKEK